MIMPENECLSKNRIQYILQKSYSNHHFNNN